MPKVPPATTDQRQCPNCEHSLQRVNFGQSWCPACEWNLGVYDPLNLPPRGWLWLEKLGHRKAFELDRQLFEEYATQMPERAGWTKARIALVAISALVIAICISCAAVGIVLVVNSSFPGPAIGVALLVMSYWLRPRFGRLPKRKVRIRRGKGGHLWQLIDQIAEATGAHPPDMIVINLDDNAGVARLGFRRQRVLWLGMRMWLSLTPDMRVAVLAHEMAHDVNGDPDRGLLVEPAMGTFARFALATGAQRTLGYVFDPDRPARNIVQLGFEVVMWAISRVFLLLHLGVTAVGLHEHHRAEYLADTLAARVAGTQATVKALDRMVISSAVFRLIGYGAENLAPLEWASTVAHYQDKRAGEVAMLRQFSMRKADLWSSHPPSGMRARMIESQPEQPARVVPTAQLWSAIDAELSEWYATTHRHVLGTREFRPKRQIPQQPSG
jgi:heat shock protein HtpX